MHGRPAPRAGVGSQRQQPAMLHRLPLQGRFRRFLTLRSRQLIEWILQREVHMRFRLSWLGTLALFATWISVAVAQTDPLPSWNDGPAKQAIVTFVTDVTREGSPTSSRRPRGSPRSTMTERCGSNSRSTCSSPTRWTGSRGWRRSIRNGRTHSPSRRCSKATWQHSPPPVRKEPSRSSLRPMPA